MQRQSRQSSKIVEGPVMKLIGGLCTLSVVALTFSCQPSDNNHVNKFADPEIIKIYDFKDRRIADSLYQYFNHTDERYRAEAALALASIQDSSSINALGKMLTDESQIVRASAAFAIGQIQSLSGETILIEALQREKDRSIRNELIESYGKVTRHWDLLPKVKDSFLTERVSWSIYRAGLRGMANAFLDSIAAIILTSSPNADIRLGAAHYFSRTSKGFEKVQRSIINAAIADSSAEVRMASALALSKIVNDSSLSAIKHVLKNDKDYRVRVSAVRAFRTFSFEKILNDLVNALEDGNINVAVASSEIIIASIDKANWKKIVPLCRSAGNIRVRANLYAAVLAASDDKEVAEEVSRAYRQTSDPYGKASFLSALSHSVMSFGFISEQLFSSVIPVIKSTAASALVAINYRKNFDGALKEKFAAIYRKAVDEGDPAVIAIVSSTLADSTLGYKSIVKDITFLLEARKKLRLPEHIESIVPLEAAIAYLKGQGNKTLPSNTFNHPIDWPLVKTIHKSQTALISTTKGDIVVRLFVEDAPGSVANFVSLINTRYYDGNFIHRVVPNFVVQAGCKRGDGYGSEDYSIRSEFSRIRYTTGSLGMASAGKDTEGTQWFITHSPTPHLDGAYSIFGEVAEGMDVVHSLEVGDRILKIDLIK